MKFLVLDTETGGYSPKTNAFVQIGMMLCRDKEIIRETEFCIAPYGNYTMHPKAREVHGISDHQWHNGESVNYASRLIRDSFEWADVVVGHNIDFDLGFIQQLFNQPDAYYYDVKTAARECTLKMGRSILKDLKVGGSLEKIAEHFGIINDRAHTALSDARVTWEVYKRLVHME